MRWRKFSFACLHHIKSWVRNSISDDKLQSVAIAYVAGLQVWRIFSVGGANLKTICDRKYRCTTATHLREWQLMRGQCWSHIHHLARSWATAAAAAAAGNVDAAPSPVIRLIETWTPCISVQSVPLFPSSRDYNELGFKMPSLSMPCFYFVFFQFS